MHGLFNVVRAALARCLDVVIAMYNPSVSLSTLCAPYGGDMRQTLSLRTYFDQSRGKRSGQRLVQAFLEFGHAYLTDPDEPAPRPPQEEPEASLRRGFRIDCTTIRQTLSPPISERMTGTNLLPFYGVAAPARVFFRMASCCPARSVDGSMVYSSVARSGSGGSVRLLYHDLPVKFNR